MGQQGCLLVLCQPTLLLRFCVQELRQDAGNAALCVFPDKLGERLPGVVPFEKFRYFNRLRRFVQCGSRCSDLQPSHHVPSDDRKESNRACADVRSELLLQNLQQVALGEIHAEDGVKLVVPKVGLRSHGHGQGYELLRGDIGNVAHDALEVANLFEHSDVLVEDMDIELHAPPRSRRNSSRVPAAPTSVKESSSPSTARTASSLREPNSVNCPRSNRTRVSRVSPVRLATSRWLNLRALRLAATASPS